MIGYIFRGSNSVSCLSPLSMRKTLRKKICFSESKVFPLREDSLAKARPRSAIGRAPDRYPVWQHTYVSPSAFSRTAVASYWRKYVHEVLVNCLGGLSLPRKSVVRLTDHPDMTFNVYRGRKTTMQQQISCNGLSHHA